MQVRPPEVAVRAAVGLVIWLLLIFLLISPGRAFPHPHGWPSWPLRLGVGLAAGFDALCLVDIARAGQVRCLPKWAWALICLLQTPLGGIMYLSIGRIGRPRLVPPRRCEAMIELNRLTKRFGRVTAVDALSFTVRPGRVTGFLGPNGAGKTTTMRLILGLDVPTSGIALVGGRRYRQLIPAAPGRLGAGRDSRAGRPNRV